MNRRKFIKALPAGAVCATLPAWAQLRAEDPETPSEVWAEVRQQLSNLHRSTPPERTEAQEIEDARKWLRGVPLPQGRWLEVPGPEGGVRVRVLNPGRPRGVVLEIHGGGWAMGSATSDEKGNWELAQSAQVAVVSPDYRLAPEHPWPAGPQDCLAVARWLVEHGETEFGTSNLGLLGYSAGSHLAVQTLLGLSPAQREHFRVAALFYGPYDLSESPSFRLANDEEHPDLRPSQLRKMINWFLPGLSPEERRQSRYSPLYAPLEAMPPALFLVGSGDILVDDSRFMAARWAATGTEVRLLEYPGAPHAFNAFEVDFGLDPNRAAGNFISERIEA